MLVKDILETKKRRGEIIGVDRDAPVADAVKLMEANDTGSVVVWEKDGSLAGVVTFREVIRLLHKDPSGCMTTEVGAIMDDDPVIATPEDTIDHLRQMMTTKHLRYLPVMQENKLTDVVSFYDVARAVAKSFDLENRMLKQYITNWPEDN